MDNDALVAALGTDAVAAVQGYRLRVISEAERRGLRLVSAAHSEVVQESTRFRDVDPIDIRLTFHHSLGRGGLAGRVLGWGPAHGWSLSHVTANAPLTYYAGPGARALDLVPRPADVVDWAAAPTFDGPAMPPVAVELDDDPEAITRLLGFIDPRHHLHPPESLRAGRQLDRARRTPGTVRRGVEGGSVAEQPNEEGRPRGTNEQTARRPEDTMPLSAREQRVSTGSRTSWESSTRRSSRPSPSLGPGPRSGSGPRSRHLTRACWSSRCSR